MVAEENAPLTLLEVMEPLDKLFEDNNALDSNGGVISTSTTIDTAPL